MKQSNESYHELKYQKKKRDNEQFDAKIYGFPGTHKKTSAIYE